MLHGRKVNVYVKKNSEQILETKCSTKDVGKKIKKKNILGKNILKKKKIGKKMMENNFEKNFWKTNKNSGKK